MQSKYPLFKQNRILKKEALTAIRDYSYEYGRLTYQDYDDGILSGCDISVEGDTLKISPGILKYQDKILLLAETERIVYTATDCMQYLKAKIEAETSSPEFITYQVVFSLSTQMECAENELEFCRFHLRQGAELRYQYKDFFDLDTEYDTIHLISAAWSGKGGKTLAPFITKFFSEEILKAPGKRAEDIIFAYGSLNRSTAEAPAVLTHYVNDWAQTTGKWKTKDEIYKGLCAILRAAQAGQPHKELPRQERRKILID